MDGAHGAGRCACRGDPARDRRANLAPVSTGAGPSAGGGTEHALKRTLGPLMLWALGVGYVISGMYFGWNLGLPLGGPFGLLAATASL